jgi:hypothetical protein
VAPLVLPARTVSKPIVKHGASLCDLGNGRILRPLLSASCAPAIPPERKVRVHPRVRGAPTRARRFGRNPRQSYFRSTSDLENKPRPAACKSSARSFYTAPVDLAHSPRRRGMTGYCAFRPKTRAASGPTPLSSISAPRALCAEAACRRNIAATVPRRLAA